MVARSYTSVISGPSNPLFWLLSIVGVSISSYYVGYTNAGLKHLTKDSRLPSEVPAPAAPPAPSPAQGRATPFTAVATSNPEYLTKGEEMFLNTAQAMEIVTDKVTSHVYQIMFGRFLLPYYEQNPTMKMLEIGLGCDMGYGPGASTALWKQLFPKADLWEAEFDAACVEKHRDGLLKGFNVLTGDQGNDTVLDSWIEKSGGNFDVVIDDGGHQNCQIWHSFLKLWPTVKPGGLYFIKDLHVGKLPQYKQFTTVTCNEDLIVTEKLKELLDMMIQRGEFAKSDVKFFFCQHEACVLGKKQ